MSSVIHVGVFGARAVLVIERLREVGCGMLDPFEILTSREGREVRARGGRVVAVGDGPSRLEVDFRIPQGVRVDELSVRAGDIARQLVGAVR